MATSTRPLHSLKRALQLHQYSPTLPKRLLLSAAVAVAIVAVAIVAVAIVAVAIVAVAIVDLQQVQ